MPSIRGTTHLRAARKVRTGCSRKCITHQLTEYEAPAKRTQAYSLHAQSFTPSFRVLTLHVYFSVSPCCSDHNTSHLLNACETKEDADAAAADKETHIANVLDDLTAFLDVRGQSQGGMAQHEAQSYAQIDSAVFDRCAAAIDVRLSLAYNNPSCTPPSVCGCGREDALQAWTQGVKMSL
jgi:hypothetical protein